MKILLSVLCCAVLVPGDAEKVKICRANVYSAAIRAIALTLERELMLRME